jgi:glycosyltransferase involved in cell wall biosynthesis
VTPLRILHVTPYFTDAWAYGGIPRVVHALAHALARRGHDVTVCTTDVCDALTRSPRSDDFFMRWRAVPAVDLPDGLHVRVFRNISNRVAYHLQFYSPLGFKRYMSQQASSFDLAHLHACRNLPGVIAASQLRRAGVPYVLTPNGTAPRIERRRLAKLAFDLLGGDRVFRDATRLLAVTQIEAQQLHNLGADHTTIRIVPNPIDLQEFEQPCERGIFRRNRGLGTAPIVLFLGKLTPRKRLDVLIRAFHQLGDIDAQLVIAGNDMGAGRAASELVGRLGLGSRTTFVGLLRGRERLEALTDAGVLVYPSQDEIFGLAAVEALLCGTPAVVSDDSGCGEIVRGTGGGAVIPRGDVDAYARAIRAALDSPADARAAAANAGPRIRLAYGADSVAAGLEQVYSELVSST